MSAASINLDGAVVAITGGARGIGLATAKAFTARGARVAIGDLDGDATSDVAGGIGPHAIGLPLDVTDRESFAAFVAAVENNLGAIDVLVNNAGIMPAGPFLAEKPETSDAQIDVNLRGPIHGMKLVLPGMIARGRGHVVNVASMAGKAHVPGLAVYNATKYGVIGLSEAVRDELDGTGVTLTAILPTAVKTELISGLPAKGLMAVTPERVAGAVVDSVSHRRAEVAVPRWFNAYTLINSLVPRSVMRRFRKRLGAWRLMQPTSIDTSARSDYDVRISDGTASKDSVVR
jgi:NAD(P)-dependent dehydrogenase (short-subunit alcohol dehydrogenase family)